MTVVTVSSKYQVVIPKDVRERLGLKPGQKVQALAVGGRVELVPVEPIKRLRGFVKGMSTDLRREKDRV